MRIGGDRREWARMGENGPHRSQKGAVWPCTSVARWGIGSGGVPISHGYSIRGSGGGWGVLVDEVEHAQPGVGGLFLILGVMPVEEAVRGARIDDDLVFSASLGQRLVELFDVVEGDAGVVPTV